MTRAQPVTSMITRIGGIYCKDERAVGLIRRACRSCAGKRVGSATPIAVVLNIANGRRRRQVLQRVAAVLNPRERCARRGGVDGMQLLRYKGRVRGEMLSASAPFRGVGNHAAILAPENGMGGARDIPVNAAVHRHSAPGFATGRPYIGCARKARPVVCCRTAPVTSPRKSAVSRSDCQNERISIARQKHPSLARQS